MSVVVFGLVFCFLILAVLLLSLNLYTSFHWSVKAAAVVVVSAFYVFGYQSLMALLGWPTNQSLPEEFRLVGVQVYEPDKITLSEGAIYLWVASMSENAGQSVPRAYRIDYEENLHQKLVRAKVKDKDGVPQMGKLASSDLGDQSISDLDLSRYAAQSVDIDFFDLPSLILPEK